MKHLRTMLLILCVAAVAAGCAKKDMIVKETAPVQGAAEMAPATAETPPAAVVVTEPVPLPGTAAGDLTGADRAAVLASPLETVYFDFDSWILSAQAREALARNAAWLRTNTAVTVTLEGHTDERGADAYNLALGEQRAKAAMQYLLNLGISAGRLTVVSYGEEKPAVDGEDENAWSRNRRVEFIRRH